MTVRRFMGYYLAFMVVLMSGPLQIGVMGFGLYMIIWNFLYNGIFWGMIFIPIVGIGVGIVSLILGLLVSPLILLSAKLGDKD